MVARPAPEIGEPEVTPRRQGPVAPPVRPMGATPAATSARVRGPFPRPVPVIP